MIPKDKTFYREQVERCGRLSTQCLDSLTIQRLQQLAAEYRAILAQLERTPNVESMRASTGRS